MVNFIHFFSFNQNKPGTYLKGFVLFFLSLLSFQNQAQIKGSFSFDTFKISDWPNIHSFSYGIFPPYVLMIGGRTDGLHEKKSGFEITANNTSMYLWNTISNQIHKETLDSLSLELYDFFSAANAEFTQDSQYLYMMGGYGESVFGNFKTYPLFARIDLKEIINRILLNRNIAPAIKYIVDDTFAVAGGQLKIIDSVFYLVGGHYFAGKYDDDAIKTIQRYTDSYRMFKIENEEDHFTIKTINQIHDDFNFHRRDFNINPILDERGQLKLMVCSGVFQHNINRPFYNTAIIDGPTYEERFDFDHKYAAYNCARLGFYDAIQNEMHQIFFGGMAEYYRDSALQLARDPLVPFVKSVSCLTRKKDGSFDEFLLPEELPGYLGTNAEFLLSSAIQPIYPDIIDLNQFTKDTHFIGTIFGGIYNPLNERNPWEKNQAKKTTSNPYLIKVNYHPTTINSSKTVKVNRKPFTFKLTPNPITEKFKVVFDDTYPVKKATIWIQDSNGKYCYFNTINSVQNNQIEIEFKNQIPENYFIRILVNDELLNGCSFQIAN